MIFNFLSRHNNIIESYKFVGHHQKSVILFVLFSLSFDINAEILGVRITAGPWATEYTGFISDSNTSNSSLNFKDDLNLKNNFQSFFYVYIEQPNASIPNFRIGQTGLKTKGVSTLTKTLTISGTTYSVNEKIKTNFDLDHLEAAFYWRIINSDIRFDLGLNVKNFGGEVAFSGAASGKVDNSFNASVPMIFSGIETDLPLTAFVVGVTGSYIDIGKALLSDILVFIKFKTDYYIGAELGYRNFQVNFEDNSVKTQVKITGLYLNGFINF